jgi:hypothetical protein
MMQYKMPCTPLEWLPTKSIKLWKLVSISRPLLLSVSNNLWTIVTKQLTKSCEILQNENQEKVVEDIVGIKMFRQF